MEPNPDLRPPNTSKSASPSGRKLRECVPTSFSQGVRPLFNYLKAEPEIRGNEEAFELVMRSQLSLKVLNY